MASQSRHAAITELVSVISTAVSALNLVEDELQWIARLGEDKYPCVYMVELGEVDINREITSTRLVTIALGVTLLYRATDTTEEAARGYMDTMLDAIEQAQVGSLSNKCLKIDAMPAGKPSLADDAIRSRNRLVHITLQRDF